MAKTPIITVSDRVRIPKSLIPFKVVKKRYIKTLYNDTSCEKCSNLEDRSRHNEICQSCPSFMGRFVLVNKQEYRDDDVYSIPQGDLNAVTSLLQKKGVKFKVDDQREEKPFRTKGIKFTGKLRNGEIADGVETAKQQKAVDEWLRYKNGGILAPPRSGKTVLATYLVCELGQKTVIITHSKDLLNQFHETMTGVPAENYVKKGEEAKAGRKAMTNIPDLREETGRQVIYMPKSYAELRSFFKRNKELPDILLISYQSFIKSETAEKRIKNLINKHYSFAVIDEFQNSGATSYLRFTGRLNVKHRLWVTATDERKDGMDIISKLLNGGIRTKVDLIALQPRITFKASNVHPKVKYKSWAGAYSWLCNSKERNKEIAVQAFRDLRAGHNVIIIPVERRSQQEYLVKLINHQAKLNREKRKEKWPEELAKSYHAGSNRLSTLNWIDSVDEDGRVHKDLPTDSPRVIIPIRKMFKEGIDVKRPSMLFLTIPMSARKDRAGSPAFYQLATRVCTPHMDKPPPQIRIWMDNVGMFRSCNISLLMHEIKIKSTLSGEKPIYDLKSEDYKYASSVLFSEIQDKSKSTNKWV